MEPTPSFTAKYVPEMPSSPAGWKKFILVTGSIILAVILFVYITSPMVVTVTGTGEASVPATNATVSFTLSATDPSFPQNAVSNVKAKALAVRTYLQTKGIAETDIAESQVTAVPAGLITAGATGYQATISMAAKTTHVSDISTLVSNIYAQGALVVSQPVLSVDNQNNLDQQAFDAAMKDAKSQAAKIGNSNWKFIRKIISISQVSSPTTSTATTKAEVTNTNAQAVSNGVFKIVEAVSVTYKMW